MLVTAFLNRFLIIYSTKFVQKYTKKLRINLYESVINANWEVFIIQKHDELISAFSSETKNIGRAIAILPTLISSLITMFVQLTIAFFLNLPLTLLVVLIAVTFFFLLKRFFDIAKNNGERVRVSNRRYMGEIKNQIESIKEIKSHSVEHLHNEIFNDVLNEYEESSIKQVKSETLSTLIFTVGATILISTIFYISNVFLPKIEIWELILIVYIFARIWPLFSGLHSKIQSVYDALPSFENIDRIIKNMNSKSKKRVVSESSINLKHRITFENVTFSYSGHDEKIIDNASFSIYAKAVTVLRGKSGSGKSTIINLLMGLLEPTKGKIAVDQKVIDDSTIPAWRRSIAYMSQDPIILNKTIRENIIRFNPDATEQDVISALEKAEALGFVDGLDKGIDTIIGNKGTRLSGGEKQRIALARVLVSRPSILILDEATNALDKENERNIQETIKNLKKDITIVIIAHEANFVDSADYIIDITDSGLIIENLK